MKPSRHFSELAVGVFVLAGILLFVYLTLDVSQLGFNPRGTYRLYTLLDNAEGVTAKTPVQVAGIPVGVVKSIDLTDEHKARVALEIKKGVTLADNVQAEVRTRGVLGDTYIEILPGQGQGRQLAEGDLIEKARPPVDYQELIRNMSAMTGDLKEITQALKVYTVSDQSRTAQILKNLEQLTANLAQFSQQNMSDMHAIVGNFRQLSADLSRISQQSGGDVEVALKRVGSITEKFERIAGNVDSVTASVERGEGSLGKLLRDTSTVDKAEEVLDNVGELTRGFAQIETELGYHMEYLGHTRDLKNYISLKLKPRPDKFFLFEVVHDPDPAAFRTKKATTITGPDGQARRFLVETDDFKKTRFSAQFGKKIHDVTLRGGLIESSGGFGVDYEKGPVALQFSAFDFSEDRPHLKFLTQLNITPTLYMVGGVDDFISKEHGLDWFVGAGFRFTDADIKSLLGGVGTLLRN